MPRPWLQVCGVALVLCAAPPRARGHSVLTETSLPLEKASVKANTAVALFLRFSGTIVPRSTKIELVPQKGEPQALPLEFGPGPGDVRVAVPPLAAGTYVLRYRVLASDGHTTEDTLHFRVTAGE